MKKRKGKRKIIEDPKLRGEWAESVFVARANEEGLAVSRPWGDSKSFDFVVGRPGRFVGVQVKSTAFELSGGYSCSVKHNNQAYPRGSFDFVAAYVIPEDMWYIVPAGKLGKRTTMIIGSDAKQAMYEEYREAWHLLREAAGGGEETPEAEVAREEVSTAEDGSGKDEAAREQAPKRPPASALERMEASGKFFRDHLAGSGTSRSRR